VYLGQEELLAEIAECVRQPTLDFVRGGMKKGKTLKSNRLPDNLFEVRFKCLRGPCTETQKLEVLVTPDKNFCPEAHLIRKPYVKQHDCQSYLERYGPICVTATDLFILLRAYPARFKRFPSVPRERATFYEEGGVVKIGCTELLAKDWQKRYEDAPTIKFVCRVPLCGDKDAIITLALTGQPTPESETVGRERAADALGCRHDADRRESRRPGIVGFYLPVLFHGNKVNRFRHHFLWCF
jgi:hypothetical protein